MGAFEDILNKAEEADRAVLNKYPDLKKFLNEDLPAIQTKYADVDGRLKKWEDWRTKQWDDESGTTKTEKAMAELYRAEQARATALEAAQAAGGEMTFEEILGNLQQKGFATKAEIESVVSEKTKTLFSKEDGEKLGNNLDSALQFVYAKSYNLGRRHEKEFGEELDMGEVLKYMGANKIHDPEAAYTQMTATKRADLQKKLATEADEKNKKAIEDAKAAGILEGEKKAAMSGRVPTDQSGPGLGHMERARMERAKASKTADGQADVPANVKLGENVLSTLGYEELLKNRASV